MSARDAALLMATGALLELPSIMRSGSRKTKQEDGSFYIHRLRHAANRSLSYGAIYAIHASSAWLFRIAIMRAGLRRLRNLRWLIAALCSASTQLVLPDPLPGIVCALMVPRSLGHLLMERFPSLQSIPLICVWVVVAVAMNLQLWTRFHLMPPRWREIMMNAAGMRGREDAVMHRSEAQEVIPCDAPELGLHPGESCIHSALGALKRGLPAVFTFYSLIYVVKFLASLRSAAARAAWQKTPANQLLLLLTNLFRSTVTLWLSCAGGRIAYCLQSRLFEGDFKWWLGGVVGFFASFISLLDSMQSRVELIEFNAGYVIHTESVYMASRTADVKGATRFLSAMLLAIATAAHVASTKGKGLLLLPMLAKIWKVNA